MCVFVYIYIYIYREREIEILTYIYIYILYMSKTNISFITSNRETMPIKSMLCWRGAGSASCCARSR